MSFKLDETGLMKATVSTYLSTAALLVAAALFVFSCYTAASDAQGAILFLFSGPVTLLLLAVAVVFGLLARRERPVAGSILFRLALVELAFVLAFFVSAFFQPLRWFPEGVIGAVSWGYQAITGESPYTTAHESHDVTGMIRAELDFSKGQRIDLARIRTAHDWDRVCFFGSNTSDSISTLIFMHGKTVAYAIDFPRGEADFANLTTRCFPRDSAVFERNPAAGSGMEFIAAGR